MPMSNYPNGFLDGITIRGVPILQSHSGKVFFVNNSSVLPSNGISGSDANDGSYLRPFSTLDYAIGRCTAGRGDIILLMPGHAETVSAAGSITVDVSGVTIVGLGRGELRPIFGYSATTSTFLVTAANVSLANLVHKSNVASLATMTQISALDCTIENCEYREGSGSGLGFIEVGTADNDTDRLHIKNCRFYSTGSNQDHFIEILKDMIQIRIEDCEGTGDCDEGCIAIPAGGNACLDLQIKRCVFRNTQTNIAAISINGTSCTGVIQDCLLITDTQASALDNGSLATDGVRWASESDQTASMPAIVPTAATADANYNPILGYGVTKVSNLADGSGTDDLFTVTGRVLITSLTGEVTTVVGGAATMKLRDITNSVDLCAATTIDSDAVGTMYGLPGLSAQILNGTGGTPVVGSIPNVTTPSGSAMQIVGDAQAALTISHVLDAADTGAVTWRLYYFPLVAGATVAAAA